MKNFSRLKQIISTLLFFVSFGAVLKAIPSEFSWNYPDNLEWQKTDNSLPGKILLTAEQCNNDLTGVLNPGIKQGYYLAIIDNNKEWYDIYVLNSDGANNQWVKKSSIVSERPFTFDRIYFCNIHYAVILGHSGTDPVILTPVLPEGVKEDDFDWTTTSFWKMHNQVNPKPIIRPSIREMEDGEVFWFDNPLDGDDALYFEVENIAFSLPISQKPQKYVSIQASSFNPIRLESAYDIPCSNDKTNGMFIRVNELTDFKIDSNGQFISYTTLSYLGLTKDGETYIAPVPKVVEN